MCDRYKDKGEEELRTRLLEVVEDPTFRDSNLQKKRVLSAIGKADVDGQCEIEPHEASVLH